MIFRFGSRAARDAWVAGGRKAGEQRVAILSAEVPSSLRFRICGAARKTGLTLVDVAESTRTT